MGSKYSFPSKVEYVFLVWVPIVTAFIGWITNWVAIRMLFRPRQPLKLLGLRFQGLIPRRQSDFAAKIGVTIGQEILNTHTIKEEFTQINLTPYLEDIAHRIVYGKLGQKLKEVPFVGALINDEMLIKFEKMAVESIREEAEPLMGQLASEVEKQVDVQTLVKKKVENFDLEKLESLVMKVAQQELRMIEWLGGVLGFIVGIGQLALLWVLGSLNL